MKRALFTSKNLIGDAMYISQAWERWHQANPDYEIELLTLNDHVKTLYKGMPVPLRAMYYTREDHALDVYDFRHTFNVNAAFALSDQKQQHIAESYADLLGVPLEKKTDLSHLKPIYNPPQSLTIQDYEMGLILISAFSASCSSRGTPPGPPNKMLPWFTWRPILKEIRKTFPNTPIRFLGAPTDMVPMGYASGLIEPGEYMLGVPLDRLAKIMASALFVITLDNGMAHLAASQGTREFVFYPRALGTHYILPLGNPKMRFIHMDPNQLRPAQAVWSIREAWEAWGLV